MVGDERACRFLMILSMRWRYVAVFYGIISRRVYRVLLVTHYRKGNIIIVMVYVIYRELMAGQPPKISVDAVLVIAATE